MRHRLSIITINYNDKNGLEKTIKSVINQSCRDYEFIVVDGGSNDGSADIIKNHTDYIDKWVSEPDKGIYNAMNKGALMASGDYITYLNSGDEFHDQDVTRDIISHLDRETDIIFGNVLNVHRGGLTNIYRFTRPISLMSLYRSVVNHSGAFISRRQQLKRPYNESLKICSDRQFFIESLVIDNCSYRQIDRIITRFDKTGVSSSKESDELMDKENEMILDLTVPPRIASDYRRTNLILQDLTSELTHYQGLTKSYAKLIMAILKLYRIITRKTIMMLHICYALNEGYLPYCLASIASVLHNNTDSSFHFHILTDSMSAYAQTQAHECVTQWGGTDVTFHFVDNSLLEGQNLEWSPYGWYRIFAGTYYRQTSIRSCILTAM